MGKLNMYHLINNQHRPDYESVMAYRNEMIRQREQMHLEEVARAGLPPRRTLARALAGYAGRRLMRAGEHLLAMADSMQDARQAEELEWA